MNRALALLAPLALTGASFAQAPDIAAFVELRPTWQVRSGAKNVFRYYDPLVRYSLVGLRLGLEPGLRGYVAQRLEKAPGDGDPEGIDEAWVEDPGVWRIGKQYLPFGRQGLLRETVNAVRFDTRLVFEDVPIAMAACDGGPGRPRGVAGRIGRSAGLSFAVGDHFGVQQTAFAAFRDPEEAPGKGGGHRLVLGLDAERSFGPTLATVEWSALREANRVADPDRDFSEVRVQWVTRGTRYPITASWGREWRSRRDVYRIEAQLGQKGAVVYVPAIRTERLRFRDFSLTAVVRL